MLFLFSTASIITAAHTIHKRTKDVPCRNARAIIIVSLLPYASVLARFLEEFAWPTNAVWDVTRPLYFCPIHLQRHICKYVFKILGKKDFDCYVPRGDSRRMETQTTTEATTIVLNLKLPIADLSLLYFFLIRFFLAKRVLVYSTGCYSLRGERLDQATNFILYYIYSSLLGPS